MKTRIARALLLVILMVLGQVLVFSPKTSAEESWVDNLATVEPDGDSALLSPAIP